MKCSIKTVPFIALLLLKINNSHFLQVPKLIDLHQQLIRMTMNMTLKRGIQGEVRRVEFRKRCPTLKKSATKPMHSTSHPVSSATNSLPGGKSTELLWPLWHSWPLGEQSSARRSA